MSSLSYIKPEKLDLKKHPDFDERWVQKLIEDDPSILGLPGELEVRRTEKRLPGRGRLDLLLVDPETNRRYELELQLGPTDESHIIRTIEYWDLERRRYAEYEHCAVLVAESITDRFFNVISLFREAVPIFAIQMSGLKIGNQIAVHFTKILDPLADRDEDDEDRAPTIDRNEWVRRVGDEIVSIVDSCTEMLRRIDPSITISYRRDFIGASVDDRVTNLVKFYPKKRFVRVAPKVPPDEWRSRLEDAGLTVISNSSSGNRVRFRLKPDQVSTHAKLLDSVFAACYQYNTQTNA